MTNDSLAVNHPVENNQINVIQGVWRLADPKITLASMSALLVGASSSFYFGAIHWGWLITTVMGIFFIEVAKNASGEVYDWDSGTDQAIKDNERTPFSGGKRVLVDGLMTRSQTLLCAGIFYALGILMGLIIAFLREPAVIWIGLAGVGLAFFYHAPPLALSYRGLGELAVSIAYGPLIVIGAFLVQTGRYEMSVLWISLPIGLAIGSFLWINEFPDSRADALSHKNTLVVKLGRHRAARIFALIVGVVYLSVGILPWMGLPFLVWLGFAGFLPAAVAVLRTYRDPQNNMILPKVQALTLLSFVLLSVGVSLGLILSRI